MLSLNKLSLVHILLLALLPLAPGQAADTADRAALTQATLELQRDLLLTKERHSPRERYGLGLYLDMAALANSTVENIHITLDGATIVEQQLSAAELAMLNAGAMKQLSVIPMRPGKHILKTTIQGNGKRVTKTVEVDKSGGRDHLKITIINPLQQRTPDITYTHETWQAAQ